MSLGRGLVVRWRQKSSRSSDLGIDTSNESWGFLGAIGVWACYNTGTKVQGSSKIILNTSNVVLDVLRGPVLRRDVNSLLSKKHNM